MEDLNKLCPSILDAAQAFTSVKNAKDALEAIAEYSAPIVGAIVRASFSEGGPTARELIYELFAAKVSVFSPHGTLIWIGGAETEHVEWECEGWGHENSGMNKGVPIDEVVDIRFSLETGRVFIVTKESWT